MKLDGIRVVDLTMFLPGPMLTLMMSDHGADVIRIEPPRGEPSRDMAPFVDGQSVWFRNTHRGKRSMVLDLKTPVLQGLMRELIDYAATQSNLDTQGLRCHLSHKGYSEFLNTLLHQQVYQHGRFARPEAPLEEVRPQWGRYLADFRQRLVRKDLDRAVRELAEDPNEGNLVRLKANQSLSHGGAGRETDPGDSNRAGDLDRTGSDGSKRANGDGR